MNFIDKIKTAWKAFQEPQSVKTAEKSTYLSPYYDKSYLRPYNPDDIIQQKGIETYREMMIDDQVKAVMYMKKLSVLSTGGEVKPNELDEQGEEKAEFCNYVLDEFMKGSFNRSLFKIMTAYQYGYSVTEKIFEKIQTGQFKGKVGIKNLKTRPPESFEFHTDKYGNLDFVKQYQEDKSSKIDPKYLIIYTYNEEFDGNFYGKSDLASAYTAWWNKKFNRKFRNIRNERFGMPLALAYYRPGASKKEKDELMNMVQNLQSKSAGIVPRMGEDEEIVKFIESKAQQGKNDAYNTAINYEDRSIARALLMPDMLGFSENKYGSRALGDTQFNLFLRILDFLRNELEEEVIFEQILKQLVKINYPNTQHFPKFKFSPLTEDDKQSIVDTFTNAVKNGVISPTPKDINKTKELLGYPVEEDPEVPQEEEEEEPVEIDESECEHNHKQFAESLNRRPNKYERKMNFTEIRETLDDKQKQVVDKSAKIMRDIQEDLFDEITDVRPTENNDIQYIRDLELDFSELKPILTESFQDIYQKGRQKATEVIEDKQFQSMAALDLPPEKAVEWFDAQADFAIAGVDKEVTDKTKQQLLTGLSQGESTKAVIADIEKTFAPYVAGKVSKDLVENPHRIETIVRTTFTSAYNKGLKQESQASRVVEAYEYSAVLDSRTTDYCSSMDGEIFKKTNPNFNTPPAHYNCRSIIVPVVRSEKYSLNGVNPQEPVSGVTRSPGF